MIAIGITGGIGMGKTTSARLLSERNVPLVDTDILARQVVEPGQPALAEVGRLFGPEIIGPNGQLRRDQLARQVFTDGSLRKRLEEILHPRIRELWHAQMAGWRAEGKPLAVVVIPLLFETHAEAELDATICVACSAETQRRRLAERGWSAGEIQQRIAAQMPIEEKMNKADYVIWTEASLDVLTAQLDRILTSLSGALATKG